MIIMIIFLVLSVVFLNGIDCNVLNQNEVYSLLHKELNKNSYYDIANLSKGGQNLYVSKK